MQIEKKNFIGGLNSDTEDRLIPNGDYRYALNVRASKSDGSNEGAIENTKGNTLVTVPLPGGKNKVIGALDNVKENTVIYFLWNSLSEHSIYEYNATTSAVTLILKTSLLKFKYDKYINDPTIIGDTLFFNDRVNEPRSINLTRARNNDYPVPFLEEFLNVIVPAPGFPAEVEYLDDSTVTTNNVRNKIFQFRYKYVYLDDEQSAWSPISKIPLPVGENLYRPSGYYPLEINNKIRVTFKLGGEYVKRVKIAVRKGNAGDFVLVEDFDKEKIDLGVAPPDEWSYDFYNDEIPTPIDNDGNSGMRLFDNVPLTADAMSQIDGNKIAFGGITEGYDPVDVDMDVTVNTGSSVSVAPPGIQVALTNNAEYDPIMGIDPRRYIIQPIPSKGRKLGNDGYLLLAAQTQKNVNTNVPSSYRYEPPGLGTLVPISYYNNLAMFGYVTNLTSGNYPPPPALPIKDRSLYLKNASTGNTIRAGGSVMNEVVFLPPNGAGIRYVVKTKLYYYKLGDGDALASKEIRVQYTTQAGDTEIDVVNALRQKLIDLNTLRDDLVDIRFTNSQRRDAGAWSWGRNAVVPPNTSMLRIWGEAFVPEDKKGIDTFPVAAGGHTGAAYRMKTSVEVYAGWTLKSKKSLKAGATHGVGIVYYDGPNRSGLTNISNIAGERRFFVPFFSEQNVPPGNVPDETTLTLTINHDPPEWADRYQIVYTGNQTVQNIPGVTGYKGFLQFQLKFVNRDPAPGGGSPTAKTANLINVFQYNATVPESVDLGYSYTKGDRIRFITRPVIYNGAAPNYLQEYKDVEVISYDSGSGIIQFKDPGISNLEDCLVEIYSPKAPTDSLIYNEIGECFPIINGKHTGNGQDQTDGTPAIVNLDDIGDVYMRFRTFPVSSVIESYAFSDFYESNSWNKGRPNKVDNNIKRVKRDSTIRFSNTLVPETNINGLSEFDDFNFEAYDEQYGTIQRMYASDKDLIVFQNLKVGKVRIGQTTLYGNEGTSISTLKSQDKVLSDMVYYSGEYGIGINPESFSVYGNRIYFTDAARGVVLRLGGDGLTPISEYSMHNYFTDMFTDIINAGGDYKIFGEFDVRFGEYVLSIQGDIRLLNVPEQVDTDVDGGATGGGVFTDDDEGDTRGGGTTGGGLDDGGDTRGVDTGGVGEDDDIRDNGDLPGDDVILEIIPANPDAVKNTLAFSENKKRWCTFYSYVPDYMVANNARLLTFNAGRLYKHNDNSIYNNFYGDQFTSKVRLISNISPSDIKVYNSFFTESNKPWSVPTIKNQFGQESSLIVEDFSDEEGVYKSNFLKDSNTPNVDLPLIEGDDLRCHSMDIEMENADTEEVKLFSVGINVTSSQLTNR